jgi:hypothetical protein
MPKLLGPPYHGLLPELNRVSPSLSLSSPPPSPSWQSWTPLCVTGEADLRRISSDFYFGGFSSNLGPKCTCLWFSSATPRNFQALFQTRPRPLTSILFQICYLSIILLFEDILLAWKIHHSIPGRGERGSFFFSKTSRPPLSPTKSPI